MKKLVYKDLRRRGGILHGKQNFNAQVKKRLGEKRAEQQGILADTYDYDVWVGDSKKRAVKMQDMIDKKMRCDIAWAEKRQRPEPSKERWVVKTNATPRGKVEVDYTTYPNPYLHPYKTVLINGIRHETLHSWASRDRDIILSNDLIRIPKALERLKKYKNYVSLLERGKVNAYYI